MICLEDLVPENHIYRKFQTLWNLKPIRTELERLEANSDYKGYGIFRMFLCLLIQFLEDLSDRELEKFLSENNASKWFCQFGLTDNPLLWWFCDSLANVIDGEWFKHVAPKQGAVHADKGYCDKNVQMVAKANNLHLCAIKKNNMKDKNHDLELWYLVLRSPYERVFSNQIKGTLRI